MRPAQTFFWLQLDISDSGTLNAQSLKQIKAGGDGVGLRVYDPGCAAANHITMLDYALSYIILSAPVHLQ
jgi:hypothetical protein